MATPAQKTLVFSLPMMLLTSKGGDQNWSFIDIPMGDLEALGPYLAALTAHTNSFAKSANAQWKVVFWWSVDAKTWSPPTPIDLFAAITAEGQAIQVAYNDATKFGIHLRFAYAIRAGAGTAIESVTAGGYIVADLKT
jgi:hypothetical protein